MRARGGLLEAAEVVNAERATVEIETEHGWAVEAVVEVVIVRHGGVETAIVRGVGVAFVHDVVIAIACGAVAATVRDDAVVAEDANFADETAVVDEVVNLSVWAGETVAALTVEGWGYRCLPN